MGGTRIGGLKARDTNKKRQGEDFYRVIGAAGGANGRTGGFYGNPERARTAGAKGGSVSRRGKALPKPKSRSSGYPLNLFKLFKRRK